MSSGPFGFMRRLSLKWRLSISFAGIAVITAGVIGAVLIPILSSHYRGAEETYLEAAAERAVRDLSALSWKKNSVELASAAKGVALVTQARVALTDPSGAVVADSGSPWTVDPSGLLAQPVAAQPLPNPLGGGLFGTDLSDATTPRSDLTVQRPVNRNGRLLGYVKLSETPAYARAALLNTAKAWGLAGLLGVILAALVGWLVALRLTRPIGALTDASDRMARGELGVRAAIERGDEVGHLATSFDVMASRVEETVVSLRRFVADAAHEIGTPLTALQANLDLANYHAQTNDERRLIELAIGQTRRLEDLATGLLRLSRLEAGDTSQEPQPVELGMLARHAADAAASRADQAEIDLRLDVPGGEVLVVGDGDKLEIALGNLLDNALKFTPKGGTVVVGLRRQNGWARLWVEDTGIGVPPEDVAALFQRFHRGRNASAYSGNGLGLAIVRATMEMHGGSVKCESDAQGSRFELTLPLRV